MAGASVSSPSSRAIGGSAPTTYAYDSPEHDFKADLELDGAGMVAHYPGLWVREPHPAPPPSRASAVAATRAMSYRSPKTEVRESPIHGRGLFAREAIGRGEIVVIKGGYVFDTATLRTIDKSVGSAEIPVADGLVIGLVDPSEREGGMIWSNHSCEPNIGVKGQIVFVAMRDIRAGEELTHDWATTDDDSYEMACRCGAPSCRRTISGQDWRRRDLQGKYRGYIAWYIQRKIDEGR